MPRCLLGVISGHLGLAKKVKTYCFGNEVAKKEFFKHPSANLARAEA